MNVRFMTFCSVEQKEDAFNGTALHDFGVD